MDAAAIIPHLLEQDWGTFSLLVTRFSRWCGYDAVMHRLDTLDLSALFTSDVHGTGHIHRVILHGGLTAMEEGLSPEDTSLLLDLCAYHDVGRRDDSPDPEHGARSALRLQALTGRTGEDLRILQGCCAAHSLPDRQMDRALAACGARDMLRCKALAELFKDCDGLDRVRIGDLDPGFLRRDSSIARIPFAQELFVRYQRCIGKAPKPLFSPEEVAAWRTGARSEAVN